MVTDARQRASRTGPAELTGAGTTAAVLLALGAAGCFAVSNVAQMDAVGRGGAGRVLEARVLTRVARDPLWLAGLAASVLGFGLEAAALSMAPVVLVQPLIVAELPLALPIASRLAGRRLGRAEWTGIGLVASGLVGILAVIRPSDAPITAGPATWGGLFAAVALVAAALTVLGSRAGPVGRTTSLAAAAGVVFGLLSVVTKATTHQLEVHGAGVLAGWQPWALAGIGLVGITLAQNALGAGPLAVSLPLLDLGEPVAGSLIATTAFGERLGSLGTVGVAALVVALGAVLAGVALLDRSPLVRAEAREVRATARPGATRRR